MTMTNAEISEAVARKLGWTLQCDAHDPFGVGVWVSNKEIREPYQMPDYAGSIQAAWEIMESGEVTSIFKFGKGWVAHAKSSAQQEECFHADTAPLAICLAFLKLEDK